MSAASGELQATGFQIMNGWKEGEDEALLPVQQTQQRQPVQGEREDWWVARAGSLLKAVLDVRKSKPRKSAAAGPGPDLDKARFTAGVVRFYEAVLKEPIPDKMLHLVDEIEKQERKS